MTGSRKVPAGEERLKEDPVERVGAARRLPAAILDGFFMLILVVAGVTIYSVVGGAQLGMHAQQALGVPVTWNNIASDKLWEQYGRRSEEMARDIERIVLVDFTAEQAEFVGRTLSDSMEEYFAPDRLSLRFFLDLDESELDALVDEAFDAVVAAGRSDISETDVNKLRTEVKSAMDEFGVGTIVPRVIDFAIWLLFLPTIIVLVYGLGEAIFGRSLGKLVTGIYIGRDDGERAYVGTLMLRYVVKNSPMLLLTLALLLRSPGLAIAAGAAAVVVTVGILVMLGPERRSVYDYIARTAVFKKGFGADE